MQALVSVALCSLCTASSLAIGRFDNWTTQDGLPQNSINAILQTRDGYIWLATYGGLVPYDGVQFTVFTRGNTSGLGSNRVVCLMETSDGALWVGTEDGGVSRLKDGAFTAYTTEDGLPENNIWGFAVDNENPLLVVTQHGVVRWAGGQFVHYPYNRKNINSQSAGLYYYKINNQSRLLDGPGSPLALIMEKLSDQAITSISVDASRRVRVGNRSSRKYENDRLLKFDEKDGVPRSAVTGCYEDRQGAIRMSTEEGGVPKFKDGHFNRYTTADGLSSSSTAAIFQDREGSMWIGTTNAGLNRLERQIITAYSEQDGLLGKNASFINVSGLRHMEAGERLMMKSHPLSMFSTLRRLEAVEGATPEISSFVNVFIRGDDVHRSRPRNPFPPSPSSAPVSPERATFNFQLATFNPFPGPFARRRK